MPRKPKKHICRTQLGLELTVLSSMAPAPAIREIVAQYYLGSGVRVSVEAAGGLDVIRRVRDAAEVDLILVGREALEPLLREGYCHSPQDLMASPIGIAARTGEQHPSIADETDFRAALLHARSVGISTGPSGSYMETLFQRWGIQSALRRRILIPPPGTSVASMIASGDVSLGVQQMSELINQEHVAVLGLLPPSIQKLTIFAVAITRGCTHPIESQKFFVFANASVSNLIKSRHGMLPIA